jgi:hypothetical protein
VDFSGSVSFIKQLAWPTRVHGNTWHWHLQVNFHLHKHILCLPEGSSVADASPVDYMHEKTAMTTVFIRVCMADEKVTLVMPCLPNGISSRSCCDLTGIFI